MLNTLKRSLDDFGLVIFDMDNTLANQETSELLPGVAEWCTQHGASFQIAIATNQGGVGLRYWMETEAYGSPEDFPTHDMVWEHINRVTRQLPLPPGQLIATLACYRYQSKKSKKWSPIPPGHGQSPAWFQSWRKPRPGMLVEAMRLAEVEPANTLMVGDSEEDYQAAIAAACGFMWAWEFFGRPEPVEVAVK